MNLLNSKLLRPFNKSLSMKSQFFLKNFLKYILLIMLPLCIISFYSLWRFHKDATLSIETRNQNLMYQLKIQMDSMFQTVDNISTFLSDNMQIDDTLKNYFQDNIPSSQLQKQINLISNYLYSMLSLNNYADSVYLFYNNDFGRYIVANKHTYHAQNYSSINKVPQYQTFDKDFWYETKSIPTYSSTPSKKVLTLHKKIYPPYLPLTSRGFLSINFSLKTIDEYISQIDIYPNQVILFLQDNGTSIYQNSEGNYAWVWDLLAPHLDSNTEYHFLHIQYQNKPYIASVISATMDGLYYVSLVPYISVYQESFLLATLFLFISFLVCILSIFLSTLTTSLEYKQLENIINIIDNPKKYLSEVPMNKFSLFYTPHQYILNNVLRLFFEQQYLKVQLEKEQYQMQNLELKALQHQINPHFLFNTLHSIYWESIYLTNGPNICSSMISDLSEIISYSFTNSNHKEPIYKELDYLRHYNNIMKKRNNYNYEIIEDIDENVLDFPIIKMLLQPLVENCLYHGIKPKEGHGIIKIKIFLRNDKIIIHILDNGLGITEERLKQLRNQLHTVDVPDEHIGLLNTNKRLVLAYGKSSMIHLYSRYQSGTIVTFSIPIESTD